MTKWLNLAWLSLLSLLLLCGPAPAASYRDNARHLAFAPPEGWSAMPPQLLAAINAEIKRPEIRFDAGFLPSRPAPGSCTYMLVIVKPVKTAGVSYEAIEAALTKELSDAA